MKFLRNILLAVVLVSSCGKEASPLVTILVPQIISTEVLPGSDAATLYASVAGSTNFTSCGFGIVKDGAIREYSASLDPSSMSFTASPDGLIPNSEYGFYAFVANGMSRIQTPERSFHTQAVGPIDPTVRFTAVSVVPGTRSAILNATLSETEDVTDCGFSVSADGENYTDCPSALSGNGFTYTWENLEPEKPYSMRAWVMQRGQRIVSDVVCFNTEKEIHTVSFTSLEATPEAFSVVLRATVDDATYVEYCGFGLSREGRTAVEYASVMDGNTFTVQVGELLPNTEYIYYAFVSVDGKRQTSEFARFQTAEDKTVHIMDIGADAQETEVRLSARLSMTEGVSEAGFGLAAHESDFTEKTVTIGADGNLSLLWEGLQADTHYRFYVYAQTADGRVVSDVLDFYTKKTPSGDIDWVSVTAQINEASVTLKAVLSGTEGISDYGFGLSINQYDFVEYSASLKEDGFEKTLSNLSPGTTYYYYAYFSLNGEYHKSETVSFQL